MLDVTIALHNFTYKGNEYHARIFFFPHQHLTQSTPPEGKETLFGLDSNVVGWSLDFLRVKVN